VFDSKNILLYPVSLIYGAATGIRNFLYDKKLLKTVEFSLPVICVGNISMGGTGKTPHTEYIARLLGSRFNVAVLSRGYKRKSEGFRFVEKDSTSTESGDEPLQIKRKLPSVIVAVDNDRVSGIKRILREKPGTEVIILDDGFQHRRVTPGLSVVLSDFSKLFTEDHLLPYGSLRENRRNISRADILLVTKTPTHSDGERKNIAGELAEKGIGNIFFTSVGYMDPVPVFDEYTDRGLNTSFSGAEAVVVTGIASPEPFITHLQGILSDIVHLSFPDHHHFSGKDIEAVTSAWHKLKSTARYLITTEKDAVRLREFSNIEEEIRRASFFVPVRIGFPDDDQDQFDNLIIKYAGENRRNNPISEVERNQGS
jgi:tetraacyldisaccharide 4'-kinase